MRLRSMKRYAERCFARRIFRDRACRRRQGSVPRARVRVRIDGVQSSREDGDGRAAGVEASFVRGGVDAEREAARDRESRGGELRARSERAVFFPSALARRVPTMASVASISGRRRARIVCATTPRRRRRADRSRTADMECGGERRENLSARSTNLTPRRLHVFIRFARVGESRSIFREQRRVLADNRDAPSQLPPPAARKSFHRGVAAVRCDGDGIIIVCFGECGSHCDMGLTLADS